METRSAPIWPTIDPNRRVVYMMGSGGARTVTVHNASDGATVRTIVVGGKSAYGAEFGATTCWPGRPLPGGCSR